jgi:hypothetical protein
MRRKTTLRASACSPPVHDRPPTITRTVAAPRNCNPTNAVSAPEVAIMRRVAPRDGATRALSAGAAMRSARAVSAMASARERAMSPLAVRSSWTVPWSGIAMRTTRTTSTKRASGSANPVRTPGEARGVTRRSRSRIDGRTVAQGNQKPARRARQSGSAHGRAKRRVDRRIGRTECHRQAGIRRTGERTHHRL